jgi:hypothetical protein
MLPNSKCLKSPESFQYLLLSFVAKYLTSLTTSAALKLSQLSRIAKTYIKSTVILSEITSHVHSSRSVQKSHVFRSVRISCFLRSVKRNHMFSDLPEIASFRALRNLMFQIFQRFHVSGLLEISCFSPLRTRNKTKTDDQILQCWFRWWWETILLLCSWENSSRNVLQLDTESFNWEANQEMRRKVSGGIKGLL